MSLILHIFYILEQTLSGVIGIYFVNSKDLNTKTVTIALHCVLYNVYQTLSQFFITTIILLLLWNTMAYLNWCYECRLQNTDINAFHAKLPQSLHVMYLGFGQDITRLKYFHRVT